MNTEANTKPTVEELLKPRYKVIADWPARQFFIGSILHVHEPLPDGRLRIFIDHEPEGQKEWYLWNTGKIGEIDKYPHLFKKLEWWQEREESEMPEYVKWVANCHEKGMIEPVTKWHQRAKHWAADVKSQINSIRAEYFMPATHEEYLAYINSQPKP